VLDEDLKHVEHGKKVDQMRNRMAAEAATS